MSEETFFRLSKGYTTHAVPRMISTTHGSDVLTTMKELLAQPPTGNAGIAAMCVTLALLEASDKGKITPPSENNDLDTDDNKFTWKDQGGYKVPTEMTDSLSYGIKLLLPEEFNNESEFMQLVQHTLIPRGAEIIEELGYEELCDFFIRILDQ